MLAIKIAVDDALFIAKMITETYSCEPNSKSTIPIRFKVSHRDHIFNKTGEKKYSKGHISSLQQNLKKGIIQDILHVASK